MNCIMYTIISIFVLLMIILQIFVHVLHCCQLHHPYLILFPPLPSKGVTINSLPNCLFFPIPSKDLRQILRSIDICCFLLPESVTAREKTFALWFIRCASSVTQQSSSFLAALSLHYLQIVPPTGKQSLCKESEHDL